MNKLHIGRCAAVSVAITALLGLASTTHAAVMQFNDLGNFTAAADPLTLEDFDGATTGAFTNTDFGDFSISEASANNALEVFDVSGGDLEIRFQTSSGTDPFTISFDVPVSSIGFDFNNTDTVPAGGEFLVTTLEGTTFSIGAPHTSGFFGLVLSGSSSPITSLVLNGNNASGALGSTFLDNFRYSVVPLPAAAWLLISGLIGFVTVGRRKKIV